MLREFRDKVSKAADRYAQAHPDFYKVAIPAWVVLSCLSTVWAHASHPEPTQQQIEAQVAAQRAEITERCKEKIQNSGGIDYQAAFNRCVTDTARQNWINEWKAWRERRFTPIG